MGRHNGSQNMPAMRQAFEPHLGGHRRGFLFPRASEPIPAAPRHGPAARGQQGRERDAAAREPAADSRRRVCAARARRRHAEFRNPQRAARFHSPAVRGAVRLGSQNRVRPICGERPRSDRMRSRRFRRAPRADSGRAMRSPAHVAQVRRPAMCARRSETERHPISSPGAGVRPIAAMRKRESPRCRRRRALARRTGSSAAGPGAARLDGGRLPCSGMRSSSRPGAAGRKFPACAWPGIRPLNRQSGGEPIPRRPFAVAHPRAAGVAFQRRRLGGFRAALRVARGDRDRDANSWTRKRERWRAFGAVRLSR